MKSYSSGSSPQFDLTPVIPLEHSPFRISYLIIIVIVNRILLLTLGLGCANYSLEEYHSWMLGGHVPTVFSYQ